MFLFILYSIDIEQKIKELTYMHSEGILAGELKHGPLALVDKAMPVVMIATRDPVYVKRINALQQVTAREGRPILVCEKGDTETQKYASRVIEVPHTVDCLQVRKLQLHFMAKTANDYLSMSGYIDGDSNATLILSHCCSPRMQRRLPT